MGAVVFPKYTKVWDNTFPNVIATLTGEYTGSSQVIERSIFHTSQYICAEVYAQSHVHYRR